MTRVFSNTKEPRRCKYLTINSSAVKPFFQLQSQEEKQTVFMSHLLLFFFPPPDVVSRCRFQRSARLQRHSLIWWLIISSESNLKMNLLAVFQLINVYHCRFIWQIDPFFTRQSNSLHFTRLNLESWWFLARVHDSFLSASANVLWFLSSTADWSVPNLRFCWSCALGLLSG